MGLGIRLLRWPSSLVAVRLIVVPNAASEPVRKHELLKKFPTSTGVEVRKTKCCVTGSVRYAVSLRVRSTGASITSARSETRALLSPAIRATK